MKRPVDFTLLRNIVTSLGMHTLWGREHCPEAAIMPSVTIAPATRRGKRSFLLYLHMGAHPDREAERHITCDLEQAMKRYGVRFEAMGHEYQGGMAFIVYEVAE